MESKLTDAEIIEAAIEEVRVRSLGVTAQFLENHDIVRLGGRPVIARVDRERKDDLAIVYVPVLGEKFHLAIYVDTSKVPSVSGACTEPQHNMYFAATSEDLDSGQMSALTTLKPTGGWNKGDLRQNGKLRYKFSRIEFCPNPEPDEFEDKLSKLLEFLEQDRSGVEALVEKANGGVQVASHYHIGNGMIGGVHLDKDIVRRMNVLNLEIDFDVYVGGNPLL